MKPDVPLRKTDDFQTFGNMPAKMLLADGKACELAIEDPIVEMDWASFTLVFD